MEAVRKKGSKGTLFSVVLKLPAKKETIMKLKFISFNRHSARAEHAQHFAQLSEIDRKPGGVAEMWFRVGFGHFSQPDRGHCDCEGILSISFNIIRPSTSTYLLWKVLADMKGLRVLTLVGNPVVNDIPSYRKTLILECVRIRFLRTITPKWISNEVCCMVLLFSEISDLFGFETSVW